MSGKSAVVLITASGRDGQEPGPGGPFESEYAVNIRRTQVQTELEAKKKVAKYT